MYVVLLDAYQDIFHVLYIEDTTIKRDSIVVFLLTLYAIPHGL